MSRVNDARGPGIRFCAAEELGAEALPRPSASVGELVIRVLAAGMNQGDVKNIEGSMASMTKLPRIPGRDFAGEVIEGPAHLIGAMVWGSGGDLGFSRDGSHAQYLSIPANGVTLLPEGLSPEAAAGAGVPFVTAFTAVHELAGVDRGEWVIVRGAAGAVGGAAMQLSSLAGAKAIRLVDKTEDEAKAVSLGAIAAISDPDEVTQACEELSGGMGCAALVDTVGADGLETLLTTMAPGGRVVVLSASTRHHRIDLLDFYRRRLRLLGLNSGIVDSRRGAEILASLEEGFASGKLTSPQVSERYPLSRVADAYAAVRDGRCQGRVLLRD